MGGTHAGGIAARDTNYERYGRDFFRNIGRRGGRLGRGGGFAANPALAKIAGGRGGRNSRKGLRMVEELSDGRVRYIVKKTGEEITLKHEDKFRLEEYLAKREG